MHKEIIWGFHFYDLIDKKRRLPVSLSISNLQNPLHILVIEWHLMLREKVGKQSLHKVPHLWVVFAEGRGELDTSEGLYSLCGNVAQTRPSSTLQLHKSKYRNRRKKEKLSDKEKWEKRHCNMVHKLCIMFKCCRFIWDKSIVITR